AAVARSAQPLEELRRREVERDVTVSGGRLGTDGRSPVEHRELDPFRPVRQAGVAFVRDLDIDALRAGRKLLDLRQLLRQVLPKTLRHLGVTADDGDIHADLHEILDGTLWPRT